MKPRPSQEFCPSTGEGHGDWPLPRSAESENNLQNSPTGNATLSSPRLATGLPLVAPRLILTLGRRDSACSPSYLNPQDTEASTCSVPWTHCCPECIHAGLSEHSLREPQAGSPGQSFLWKGT